MQGNWSLILNVLLLTGVIFAIARLVSVKRQTARTIRYRSPAISQAEAPAQDEIISVRRIERDDAEAPVGRITPRVSVAHAKKPAQEADQDTSIMMFLLAKENRQLAGYELLQTILAAGLRFGEGHLFHRHQFPNGQGPVLCSLAAATGTGVFDMQNIGAFSVRGLCLFMRASGNPTIDKERFSVMLETAKQLSDELDTYLLDDTRRVLDEDSVHHYYHLLNLNQAHDNPTEVEDFDQDTVKVG